MEEVFLQNKGGHKKLKAYQISEILYDITFHFTHRFLFSGDRTVDQMVQAARPGKQNIAEGSKASSTSCETEIKLTNVAKASLEELLVDYQDYLRVRNLELWGQGHERYSGLREYCRSQSLMEEYREVIPRLNAEELCNLAILPSL